MEDQAYALRRYIYYFDLQKFFGSNYFYDD